MWKLIGSTLPVCTLLLSAEAFVGKPNPLTFSKLAAKQDSSGDEAVKVKKRRSALKFPPLPKDVEAENKYGVSPRTARVVSPLQALLGMPLVLSAGAGSANALEGDFEAAVDDYFPRSLPSSDVLEAAIETLNSYGSKSDVLFGTSLCPDEVNTKPGRQSLATALQENVSKQNGIFNLGGLAGLPFVGMSGMGAFLSHCPQNGRVVILFGPHVGVSDTGIVGKVERLGRKKLSGSCGASLGAYKALTAEKLERQKMDTVKAEEIAIKEALAVLEAADASQGVISARLKIINNLKDSLASLAEESDLLEKENAELQAQLDAIGGDTIDYQEEYIIDELRPRLKEASFTDENRAVAYVTRQVYSMIFDMLKQELKANWKDPAFWDNVQEITLLGGIVINRGMSEDWFQPLKFETLSKKGKLIQRVDLLETAFGDLA